MGGEQEEQEREEEEYVLHCVHTRLVAHLHSLQHEMWQDKTFIN